MKEPNRERKGEISYEVTLNDEQKEAKRLIYNNQIVIITGRAGCGKSLVAAQTGLDFLFKKQIDTLYITRAAIEVGRSLGYMPGGVDEKFNHYIEAIIDNMYKCRKTKSEIDQLVEAQKIQGMPVQFIRGKTVDDILIVEEAQNLTPQEMEAILTRLGKSGKIIITGDNAQRDINTNLGTNGLDLAIDLSKKIDGIEWIKLTHNHRSDLVGKILDTIYGK